MFRELLCCIHNNCTGGTNRYACNVQSKRSQNACGSCLRSRRQPNFVIHIKLLFELWRTAVWYRGRTGTWSSVGGTLTRAHINYASFQGRYPEDHTNTFSKTSIGTNKMLQQDNTAMIPKYHAYNKLPLPFMFSFVRWIKATGTFIGRKALEILSTVTKLAWNHPHYA